MLPHTSLGRTHIAAKYALRGRRAALHCAIPLNARRTLVTEAVHTLSEGFLDLALAIPYPEAIPAYSSTLILVTVVSRFLLTVPFSVWAKKRQWRAEELALPQLHKERPQILKQVLTDMKRDGFRGNKDEVVAEHSKRAMPLMKARQKQLFKQFHCSPTWTMAIAPITQLPVFVLTSLTFSHVCQAPSVLDSESFFTLTSLAHSDPTLALPIILGITTLANVESARWFITPEALDREKKVEEWRQKKRAKGETVIEPKKIFQTSLRTLAVCRILIAALVPGAVQLYWVTSAVFGLGQSWIFDWIHARRRRSRPVLLEPEEHQPASPPTPTSTIIFMPKDTRTKPNARAKAARK